MNLVKQMIQELLHSKRAWAILVGTIAVIAKSAGIQIDDQQLQQILGLIAAFIATDTIRPMELKFGNPSSLKVRLVLEFLQSKRGIALIAGVLVVLSKNMGLNIPEDTIVSLLTAIMAGIAVDTVRPFVVKDVKGISNDETK